MEDIKVAKIIVESLDWNIFSEFTGEKDYRDRFINRDVFKDWSSLLEDDGYPDDFYDSDSNEDEERIWKERRDARKLHSENSLFRLELSRSENYAQLEHTFDSGKYTYQFDPKSITILKRILTGLQNKHDELGIPYSIQYVIYALTELLHTQALESFLGFNPLADIYIDATGEGDYMDKVGEMVSDIVKVLQIAGSLDEFIQLQSEEKSISNSKISKYMIKSIDYEQAQADAVKLAKEQIVIEIVHRANTFLKNFGITAQAIETMVRKNQKSWTTAYHICLIFESQIVYSCPIELFSESWSKAVKSIIEEIAKSRISIHLDETDGDDIKQAIESLQKANFYQDERREIYSTTKTNHSLAHYVFMNRKDFEIPEKFKNDID